jgi:hypothetical protein
MPFEAPAPAVSSVFSISARGVILSHGKWSFASLLVTYPPRRRSVGRIQVLPSTPAPTTRMPRRIPAAARPRLPFSTVILLLERLILRQPLPKSRHRPVESPPSLYICSNGENVPLRAGGEDADRALAPGVQHGAAAQCVGLSAAGAGSARCRKRGVIQRLRGLLAPGSLGVNPNRKAGDKRRARFPRP